MALIDQVAKVAPGFAARYVGNRLTYDINKRNRDNAQRLYDAATQTQYRKPIMGAGNSPDAIMSSAGTKLRDLARHLEENHDLVVGIFDDLLNNVVGDGAKVAPMARTRDGDLARDFNAAVSDLWEEWSQSPDTTGELGFEQLERQAARHLFRDGELFIRHVNNQRFNYQTPVPYVLDLLDADYVPMDLTSTDSRIIQGIEVNQWGAPSNYYFFKNHPGDLIATNSVLLGNTKRIPASQIMHLKFTRRLRQRRGVPVIHSVINRLQDLKDYEESERIAAKVAADFTFFIKKSSEYNGPVAVNSDKNRSFGMAAGSGFELMPGEDVGTIDANRPNTGLQDFRNSMMRAVAAGTGTRFSSISRDYNGTYSAQRQELVEAAIAYRVHFKYLMRRFYIPVYQRFIQTAIAAGRLPSTRGVDMNTILRADYRAPALPWIDPQKEANAYKTLIDTGLESRQEIQRQRGRDPVKVREEIEAEQNDEVYGSTLEQAGDVMPATDENQTANEEEDAA